MTKRLEFSKLVVAAVMLSYFVGLAIGAKVVGVCPDQLQAYLAYIGAPTATAIAFYAWKAKAENMVKLGLKSDPVNEEQEGGIR